MRLKIEDIYDYNDLFINRILRTYSPFFDGKDDARISVPLELRKRKNFKLRKRWPLKLKTRKLFCLKW